MVDWTAHEREQIQQFSGKPYETVLREIPDTDKKWKCHTCWTILKNHELLDKKCPVCGETYLQPMCPLDHNGCRHDLVARIEICPVCNQVLCPECGCHDVVSVSRVTGYLADYNGFNSAKKQEIADRMHYTVA
jgi:hypothetical protein